MKTTVLCPAAASICKDVESPFGLCTLQINSVQKCRMAALPVRKLRMQSLSSPCRLPLIRNCQEPSPNISQPSSSSKKLTTQISVKVAFFRPLGDLGRQLSVASALPSNTMHQRSSKDLKSTQKLQSSTTTTKNVLPCFYCLCRPVHDLCGLN